MLPFKIKIAVFFLLCGGVLYGQREFTSKKYNFSIKTNLDSIGNRQMQSFVDTKLHSIYLISLKLDIQSSYFDYVTNEIVDRGYFRTIIKGNKKIAKDRINTVVEVKSEDFGELFTILYSPTDKNSRGVCYIPRHGIVFCDKKGEVIGYIEICFECSNFQVLTLFTPNLNFETFPQLEILFKKYMNDYFER